MAISDKNRAQTDASEDQKRSSRREERNEPQREERTRLGGNRFFSVSGGTTITDRIMAICAKQIEEVSNPDIPLTFAVRSVSTNATNLRSHIVELSAKYQKDIAIYQFVADSGDAGTTATISLPSRQECVITFGVTDQVNETLIERSMDECELYYKTQKDTTVSWTGATIIPREIVGKDEDARLAELVRNGMNALLASFQDQIGLDDLNLADANGKLVARVQWSLGACKENLIGLPMPSDVSIELVRQTAGEKGVMDLHALGGGQRSIGTASAWFDVDFLGMSENEDRNIGRLGRVGAAPFAPRMILALPQGEMITNGTVVSTIVAASGMASPRHWWGAFVEPSFGDSDCNIGALNTIVSARAITERSGRAYSDEGPEVFVGDRARENAEAFVRLFLTDSLTISLLYAPGTPESWVLDLFDRASTNDKEANSRLIQIFDEVLDGRFSDVFTGGRIVSPVVDEIQMGWVMGRNGVKIPTHSIGLRQIATHYGTNTDPTNRWIDTYVDPNMDLAERLASRKVILEHMFGTQVNIIGQGRVLTLTPDAIVAAQDALTEFAKFEVSNPNAIERSGARGDGSFRRSLGVSSGNFGQRGRSGGSGRDYGHRSGSSKSRRR